MHRCRAEAASFRLGRACLAGPAAFLLGLNGCGHHDYRPAPLDPTHFADVFVERRLESPDLAQFMPTCGLARTPWPRTEWDAPALACAALYYNPALAGARAELQVAEAGERSAGQALPVGFTLDLEHHRDRSAGQSPWSFGPTLELGYGAAGLRTARREAAAARSQAARIELDARILAIRSRIDQALAMYAMARLRTDLLESRVRLLSSARNLIARRKVLGFASPAELLVAADEEKSAEQYGVDARGEAAAALGALAAGVGVPPAALQAKTLQVDRYAEIPPPLVDAPAALQTRALTDRSDIRLALQAYAIAEAELKEAVAAQYPEVRLSPGFLFDQADRVWKLALSLSLPPGADNAAAIATAQARREAAARAVETLQARIVAQLQEACGADQLAQHSALLAAQRLSLAERQEAVEQRRFEAGEGDRLALIRARLATLDARLLQTERIDGAWRARLRLQAALSGPATGSG